VGQHRSGCGLFDQTGASYTWTVDTIAPAAFSLLSPADGVQNQPLQPSFSWQTSSDSGTGVDHYELWIDGAKAANVPTSACAGGVCTATPPSVLSETTHTWQIRAVDAAGNAQSSPTRLLTVAVPPVAMLSVTPDPALVGHAVTFDATGSYDDHGAVVDYAFDLDGSGRFASDNGTSPTLTHVYSTPGTFTVAVRVTDREGQTAAASTMMRVYATPPAGKQLGVSINNAALFTNDPHVTIYAVWPSWATDALISNDGGFGNAQSFPVAPMIAWTLDSAGSERLPKTVYVRFTAGASVSQRITIAGSPRQLWVRARDRAGNYSRWRLARRH
jgi:hypothetical protein